MDRLTLLQRILWVALLLTLILGIASSRFFAIPPALRLPHHTVLWQAAPYGLLAVVIGVLLVLLTIARKQP